MCVLLHNNLCPNGSMNMLGGPKQVILAALGDGWEERSPLGGGPPSTNYLGSKTICYLSVI